MIPVYEEINSNSNNSNSNGKAKMMSKTNAALGVVNDMIALLDEYKIDDEVIAHINSIKESLSIIMGILRR